MNRKLTTIASIVVLVGLGVFVYFYFFNKTPSVVVAPEGGGLPLAGQGALPTDTSGAGGDSGVSTPEAVTAKLVKITDGPAVPGFAITSKPATASSSAETSVSYIDRASGNVFVYAPATKAVARTSNRTLPGIQSASWLPDASGAVVHYLSGTDSSTINSYFLRANGTEGFFLPQNLSGVAVSSTAILSLASAGNGSSVSISRTDGSGTKQVFTSPLSSIYTSFLGKTGYLLGTKASATLPGFVFSVNARGEFSRISGPFSGLRALASPSGSWLAESYVSDGVMRVALVDTTTREMIALPLGTLIEKCVWSLDSKSLYCGVPTNPPIATYPDDWYQGAIHFSDKIWKIDVAGRYAQLVLDFTKETGAALDATALAIDPTSSLLVFLNKNDESVWGYAL